MSLKSRQDETLDLAVFCGRSRFPDASVQAAAEP